MNKIEPYADPLERLQAARQEAAGRRRSNVLVETKDLSALLDRCIALEGALLECVQTFDKDQRLVAEADAFRTVERARTTLTGEAR